MPPPLSDKTAVTVSLGWLISIIVVLMGLASSSGILLYQVSELRKQVETMHAEQTKNRESIIALTSTLQGQGVLK
jgi:hypothetical protein